MALQWNQEFNTETYKNSSVISQFAAVQLDTAVSFAVLPASGASAGVAPAIGLTKATLASVGISGDIQTGGWGKAIAGASLGRGAYVACGIGTTSLVPVAASGVASALAAAGVQYPVQALGISLEAAAAGSIFTVKIAPRQVV